jgi:hypothetical protein
MRLQEALAEFQESRSCFILDQAVEPGSKSRDLAYSALMELVAWIIGFIQFIDEYSNRKKNNQQWRRERKRLGVHWALWIEPINIEITECSVDHIVIVVGHFYFS